MADWYIVFNYPSKPGWSASRVLLVMDLSLIAETSRYDLSKAPATTDSTAYLYLPDLTCLYLPDAPRSVDEMTLVGPPPACCLCLTSTLPPHIPVHACCRPLEAVVRRVPATTAGDRGAADVSSATLLLSVDNGPHNVRSCASNGCPKSKASSLVSDCHIAWTLRVERVWRQDGRREGGMDAAFFLSGHPSRRVEANH